MGERDYKGKGIERGIGIGIYIHPLFLLSFIIYTSTKCLHFSTDKGMCIVFTIFSDILAQL